MQSQTLLMTTTTLPTFFPYKLRQTKTLQQHNDVLSCIPQRLPEMVTEQSWYLRHTVWISVSLEHCRAGYLGMQARNSLEQVYLCLHRPRVVDYQLKKENKSSAYWSFYVSCHIKLFVTQT